MRSLLLVLALVGVSVGAEKKPVSTSQCKEPSFEGKTISEWIAMAKDREVEGLGRWLALTKDQEAKDMDQPTPIAVIHAFAEMGPQAERAIPILMKLVSSRDSDTSAEATWALGQIGIKAVPALTELLEDSNRYVRCYAAVGLGQVNPNSPETKKGIQIVTDLLTAQDYHLRESAAYALGQIGFQSKSVVLLSPNCSKTRKNKFALPLPKLSGRLHQQVPKHKRA